MGAAERVYIFHVYRRNGEALILHPFDTPERLMKAASGAEIVGRYGREPRIDSLRELRAELHRLADRAVEHWLADLRFVPKFLTAAATFLLAYFFFSVVVRDPLPVLDEVVLGIGTAVTVFVLMGRADLRSPIAVRRRAELRAAIDRVRFTESCFVQAVEQALEEGEPGEGWLERLSESELSGEGAEEARSFVAVLESRYRWRGGRREERALKRLVEGSMSRRRASRVDAPLYAVYRKVKRSVAAGSCV